MGMYDGGMGGLPACHQMGQDDGAHSYCSKSTCLKT